MWPMKKLSVVARVLKWLTGYKKLVSSTGEDFTSKPSKQTKDDFIAGQTN